MALIALAAFTGLGATAPSKAEAGYSWFCSSDGYAVYIAGNGHCVSGKFYDFRRVWAVTNNGDGVDHCAVGKELAGGYGSNVIPPACGTAQVQVTPCVSGRAGYAKINNNSSSPHYFFGEVAWGSDCG